MIYAMEGPICGTDNRCSFGSIKVTLLWNIYANEQLKWSLLCRWLRSSCHCLRSRFWCEPPQCRCSLTFYEKARETTDSGLFIPNYGSVVLDVSTIYLIPLQPLQGATVISILQMRKWKPRELKWFAWGHTACLVWICLVGKLVSLSSIIHRLRLKALEFHSLIFKMTPTFVHFLWQLGKPQDWESCVWPHIWGEVGFHKSFFLLSWQACYIETSQDPW